MKLSIVLCAALALTCSTVRAQLDLVHRYSLTNQNASDTVGSLNGVAGAEVSFDPALGAVFAGATQAGSVIHFPGNDVAIDSGASGGLSVEFWGQFKWNGDDANVFNIGSGTAGNGLSQWAGNGQHVFVQANGKSGSYDMYGAAEGLVPFSDSGTTPVHVVDVFDQASNLIKVYINGGLYVTGSMGGVSLANISNSVFDLGGPSFPNGGAGRLKGSISEFRIYGTALDASSIVALDSAGPNTVPNVNNLASQTAGAWTDAGTWSPQTQPTSNSLVTVAHAVTLNTTSGDALGLSINAGGSVIVIGGTLNVAGEVNLKGGGMSLDANSALNVASLDASAAAGLSVAPKATITVSRTLYANAALNMAGANVTTNNILVSNGAAFSTDSLSSFQLNGGDLNVNNGALNLTQGANTASSLEIASGGTLNVSGPSTTLDFANPITVSGRPNLFRIGGGTVTTPGLVVQEGQMVVDGNGSLVATDNFTTGQGDYRRISVYVKGSGAIQGDGNTWYIGNGYASSTNYVRLQDSANVAFKTISLLTWGAYTDGHGASSNLEISDSASLTATGDMYVMNTATDVGRSGTNYSFAQVYQHGGTVSVGGSLKLADNDQALSASTTAHEVAGAYNLSAGTLNVAGQILGGATRTGFGQALFNFHGGTLAYSGAADQPDFIRLTATPGVNGTTSDSNLRVWEGATIDTGGQNVTIKQALLAPTGRGLSAIDAAGLSNLSQIYDNGCPPWVYIAGGGGTGASAVANLNAAGQVASISVTNPGCGYTSPPTVQLIQTNVVDTVPSGSIALSDNSSYHGGLTKTGLGNLILSASNTYTGGTTITAGVLTANNINSLGTGAVNLAGGTLRIAGIRTLVDTLDIGIKFSDDGSGTVAMPVTGTAGLVPQANWNNVAGPTGTQGSLVNNHGDATAVAVSWSADACSSAFVFSQANQDWQLLNAYLSHGLDVSGTQTVSLSGIPFSKYNLIAYFNSSYMGFAGRISLAGNPTIYSAVAWATALQTPPYNLMQTDYNPSGLYKAASYAEWDNLSGGTQLISQWLNDPFEVDNGLTAVQIVSPVYGYNPIALANSVRVTKNSTIDVTDAGTAAVGDLTIGGNTLSVTGGGTGPDSSYSLTAGATTLVGDPTFDVANNGAGLGILILGAMNDGGAGHSITKTGAGTLKLAASDSYTGGTTISAGVLQVGNDHALGLGALIINQNGILDLGGFRSSDTALSGSGTILNSASGTGSTSILTVTSGGSFAGLIRDGGFGGTAPTALVLTGGLLTLSGTNTYTAGTTVSGGTLVVADPWALADETSLTVGNAGAFATAGQATQVPEPATVALLAAAGAIRLIASRRLKGRARQKKCCRS
jgi:fibronectin-binding autotransporter adhesin